MINKTPIKEDLEPVMWQEGDMLKVTKCLSLPASESLVAARGDQNKSSGKKRSSGKPAAIKETAQDVPLEPPLTANGSAADASGAPE